MHYLKRANVNKDTKFGLTIYMRCHKNNADVLKVINEFTQFKICARRIRELPATLQHRVKVPHRKAPSRSSMFILKKNDATKKHVQSQANGNAFRKSSLCVICLTKILALRMKALKKTNSLAG